ncbi:uncharacterized protein LOC124971240 isoform X4 [Sciurus carolinensis]|uniref:uncharacterized protein LOC124971240 isoform X4 n=1 Tax=Sciurus carolinensis TaxID=30640 RepID=UPI001FB300C3|nr:uncharacterized protein LOC124971240 isoform X4 [Sciurus carolinensis]XP_047390996.1 uncharacterized protein LOC124971240 isoform X4 [Sciurus carolinensis]XP_047390997.1 uncharacterized protein LOC124971240 isoform X4 [Sciurus carolinensis]
MEAQRHGRICFQASFQSRESRCPARGLQWQVDSVALEILYGWGQLSSNQSKGSCSGELYGTHNSPTAGRDFTSFVTKSQKSLFQPLDPRTSPELVGQDPGTFFRGCGSSPAGGKIWRTAKEASAEHRREPSEITTSGATAEHLKGQIARRGDLPETCGGGLVGWEKEPGKAARESEPAQAKTPSLGLAVFLHGLLMSQLSSLRRLQRPGGEYECVKEVG